MEALRHLASTSLFIQNEQIKSTTKKSTATTVPVIKEPENQTGELDFNIIKTLNFHYITIWICVFCLF